MVKIFLLENRGTVLSFLPLPELIIDQVTVTDLGLAIDIKSTSDLLSEQSVKATKSTDCCLELVLIIVLFPSGSHFITRLQIGQGPQESKG